MARTKPPLLRLSELTPGQVADFFALLEPGAPAEPGEAAPID